MTEIAPTPREIIDPEGTLPDVQLVAPDGFVHGKGITAGKYAVMHEADQIGVAHIQRNTRDNEQLFSGIRLRDNYQGKGFGMAAYLAAIENAHGEGYAFRTHDVSQTQAAARVWGKFIEAGIAEVVEPFKPYELPSGDVQYGGHVRIAPPSVETQSTHMSLDDLAHALQGVQVDLGVLGIHQSLIAHPNSVGKVAVPFREGDIVMKPGLAYRQVGLEAIADLAATGIVRNRATAEGHEHPRWGHRVFWSQGEEGAHINVAGRAVMVAPAEKLNDWATLDKLEAIYVKTPDGELRNLLAPLEDSILEHNTTR